MAQPSTGLRSDETANPYPMIVCKLPNIPPSIQKKWREKLAATYNLKGDSSPQSLQRNRSRSPTSSSIPTTYRERTPIISHAPSVEYGRVRYPPPVPEGFLSTDEARALEIPETAHLAATKLESGVERTLQKTNNVTFNNVFLSPGRHEQPSPIQFDSCHPLVQPPPPALQFSTQLSPSKPHILPSRSKAAQVIAELVAEVGAEVHQTPEEADGKKDEIPEETEEGLQQRPNDVANTPDNSGTELAGMNLNRESSDKAPSSEHIEVNPYQTTVYLDIGVHWFSGDIVIDEREIALERSCILQKIPRANARIRSHIFWTDGSLLGPCNRSENRPAGSAAVWKERGNSDWWKIVWNRAPVDTKSSTHAELYAIQLAMEEAVTQISKIRRRYGKNMCDELFILTDSQGALRRLKSTTLVITARAQLYADQYVEHIINCCDVLKAMGVAIVLRWVPGHSGDYGNELADQYARRGAEKHREEARPPGSPKFSTEPSQRSNQLRMKISNAVTITAPQPVPDSQVCGIKSGERKRSSAPTEIGFPKGKQKTVK